MNPTKPDGQQWSIRAEFTVSPQGICAPDKNYSTNTSQDKSGIRLSYCWRTNENVHHPVNATNWRPVRSLCKPVEYQKGNLTFTSTPPCRLHTTCGSNFEYHDSGYGSDLVSLNSAASGSSQSPNNPNSRKCRSTCSIVLCSNSPEENSSMPRQIKYDSLNCQIPVQNKQQNSNFHSRCDPCCQLLNSAKSRRLSENQVSCSTGPHNPTPSLHPVKDQIVESAECKPYKRDVSIQTSDSLQRCSVTNLENCQKPKLRRSDKTHSNSFNRNSDKHGQHFSHTRDSGENIQSPCPGKPNLAKNWETVGHTSDSSKKSRTIHIDVYCSDTDMERSDTSSDSWENESTSTPQTVFESPNVYVTHERARSSGLPFKLKRRARRKTSDMTSVEMDDADMDDESTTSYPSKIDSCSTINDFSSSISSIKSWKSHSLLSCTNDSVKNWAGTFPIMNRSILHKLNTERKCITGDERSNAYVSNPEKIGNKLQNIYMERNASQEFRKHAHEQQSPYDSIKENINIESEKLSKVIENEGDPQKSSEFNPYVKNAREKSTGKLINDPTGLQMLPSQYTEQIASRFGEVINIFKKPGRHKGPTKNPDCCCDYCRRHFL